MLNFPQLHVSNGWHEAALTVFPVWRGDEVGPDLVVGGRHVQVTELEGSPRVDALVAENRTDRPVLLLEGELLEAGWQDRAVGRDVVLAPGEAAVIDVCCVEQGRGHGQSQHLARGRMASLRIRAALRTSASLRQHNVWSRVSELEERLGTTPTRSLARHLDRAADPQSGAVASGRCVVRETPMPGQAGVIIALAGRPVALELFPDQAALTAYWPALLGAARLDAVGLPPSRTPAQRARDFVVAAASASLTGYSALPASTVTFEGRRRHVDLRDCATRDGQLVHLLAVDAETLATPTGA